VSAPRTRTAGSSARSTDGPGLRRRGRIAAGDLIAIAALVAGAGLLELWLRHLLTRPFYSDEAWRAYDISLGPAFLHHLGASAAPLALGWVAIENAARLVLGDTEAGLRAPMFVGLPALACATYLLARRRLGVGVSFGVACDRPSLTPAFRRAPATWSSSRPTGTRAGGHQVVGSAREHQYGPVRACDEMGGDSRRSPPAPRPARRRALRRGPRRGGRAD
jgi:hypothetical protein